MKFVHFVVPFVSLVAAMFPPSASAQVEGWRVVSNGTWASSVVPPHFWYHPTKGIVADAAGDYLMTGTASIGSGPAVLAAKVRGSSGETVWTRIDSDEASAQAKEIAVDSGGDVMVVGAARVSKLRGTDGQPLWVFSLPAAGRPEAARVSVAANGDAILSGRSDAGLHVVRIDGSTGQARWSTVDPIYEFGFIAQGIDPNGDVIVMGGQGGSTLRTRLLKLDGQTGAVRWATTIPASADDTSLDPGAMAIDPAGNILVAGDHFSGDAGGIVSGVRTSKIDGLTGAVTWSVLYRSATTITDVFGLAVDAAGDVVLTGELDTGSGSEVRTTKYRGSDGTVVWTTAARNGNRYYTADMALDAAGNVGVIANGYDGSTGLGTFVHDGATGALLWKAAYPGPPGVRSFSYGASIAFPAEAAPIVLTSFDRATYTWTLSATRYTRSGAIAWTAKPGNVVSARVLPVEPAVASRAMAVDGEGNVVVSGTSYDGEGGVDARTIRFDGATGLERWSTGVEGTGGRAVAVDAAGNAYAIVVNPATGGSGWCEIVRLEAATGTPAWRSTYGAQAGGNDSADAIAVDAAGNVFVTGHEYDREGRPHMRTAKYAGADGALLWSAVYANPAGTVSAGQSLALDAAGNALVTGYSESDLAGSAWRTTKYDGGTGVVLWTSSHRGDYTGTFPRNAGNALVVDATGDVVAAGVSSDAAGYTNATTLKYDGSSGQIVWRSRIVGSYGTNEAASAVAVDANGDAYVAVNVAGPDASRVVKYRGIDGAESWRIRDDPQDPDAASIAALVVDQTGNLVTIGATSGANAPDGNDVFAAKYDATTGAKLWGWRHGGSAGLQDSGRAIVAGPNHSLFVLGEVRESHMPVGWLIQQLQEAPVNVTVVVDGQGIVRPTSQEQAFVGARPSFELIGSPGFYAVTGGDCAGTSDGRTFTARTLVADCTLSVAFRQATLDIDDSAPAAPYDALTDGFLAFRYLMGLRGDALTRAAVSPSARRASPDAVAAQLEAMLVALDIDGDGKADALTDGLLILRYLFGLRGEPLVQGAIAPRATRLSADAIEAYFRLLMP